MLLNLMSSPRFTLIGFLAVLAGIALCRLPQLDWTIGASDLCLSLGIAILLAVYLRRCLLETEHRRWLFAVLLVGLSCIFIAQQNSAQSVKGQVRLSNSAVESVTVRRAGIAVEHHLGAPLSIDHSKGTALHLKYGFEDGRGSVMPKSLQRESLGPWYVEHLGFDFRGASQRVAVSVQHQAGKWMELSFRPGDVHTLNERLSLRLVSLGAMSTGEGHRLMFEVLQDGERSMRTVYDALPNLEARLGLSLPQIRVDGVTRVAAHKLYVYARNQGGTLYGFLGAGALMLLLVFVGRVR